MNTFNYITSSIRHYRRTHLGILAGAVLAALVVGTSLQIGSSVRGTLLNLIQSKLQRVTHAAISGENVFSADIADRLASDKDDVAAVFTLRGTAVGNDNRRANAVTVYGVDDRFFALGNATQYVPKAPIPFTCYLNLTIAEKLNVKVTDEIVLRMEKPGLIPGDAPLSIQDSRGMAVRLSVARILGPDEMGDFSLRNNTARPLNVIVDRRWLTDKLEQPGKANLLLAAEANDQGESLQTSIEAVLTPGDVGLSVKKLASGDTELTTEQVFLPTQLSNALNGAGTPVFTYFANSLSAKNRSTPYCFVCGTDNLVPDGLKSDDLVITQWLADDLGVTVGDSTEMAYFVLKPGGGLKEVTKTFTVHSIIPTADRRDLMPAFPGMADADRCSEWDPGLPVDLDKIRQKDEDYWAEYKGSPKAFVSLATAQDLWQNRFGQLTAIRFNEPEDAVRARVKAKLSAEAFGLNVIPVNQQRVRAGSGGVDFGGLFIGLSFFIIAAALILMSLLFAFGLEQRRDEIATLMALGFTRSRILRLFILEGTLIAFVGGVIGSVLAIGMNSVILHRISTVWSGTVNAMVIDAHLSLTNLISGALSAVIPAAISLWLAGRSVLKRTGTVRAVTSAFGTSSIVGYVIMTVVFGGTAVALGLIAKPSSGKDVALFFMGSGFCALLAMIGLYGAILGWMSRWRFMELGYLKLLVQALTARRGRALAVVGTMAIGLFLIAGVAANRHDPLKAENSLSSGTGGFAFYAETSVPIMDDLNSEKGQKSFNLPEQMHFMQMKHRPGADASCLNLSKVADPGILAVDPASLAERGAFSFADSVEAGNPPWLLLDKSFDDGAIPVIADNNVILWSLGKGVGKDLIIEDEFGKPLTLRFVAGLKNSIFQGWVLMSREYFSRHFPSVSGSTVFLIDATDTAETTLRDAFKDSGMEVTPTNVRLATFNRVESTYLEIFLALGSLGLLIGTIGLAIVVSRNILERRQELGILQACGFSRSRLRTLIIAEHTILLADGMTIGALAAWIAVLPALAGKSGDVPLAELGVEFLLILAMGCLFIWLGCRLALRGALSAVLRNE